MYKLNKLKKLIKLHKKRNPTYILKVLRQEVMLSEYPLHFLGANLC